MKIKFAGLIILSIVVFFGCTASSKTLSVKPSSADFGDVYLGDSSDIVLVLKNKYGKDITITNLILDGSNDFTIGSTVSTPFELPKGTEYNLTITFTPITDGTINGLLKIRHSESSKDKEVDLIGNGVPVARIQLSESTYDFQKKVTNQSHTHNFDIENTGTALLEITDMTFTGLGASSYSITSGDAPVNIQPNTKHTFTVTFAPTVVGNYPTELAITHNAINETVPYNININGEGVLLDPRITLSIGTTWDFGSVAKTLPATLICEIENTGIDPLDITSLTLTTNAEFQIDCFEDTNGNTLNCPVQVAVADKIFVSVKFSPTANQSFNDKMTIVHNGTNETSPLEISLTGIGRDTLSKTFSYSGMIEDWVVPNNVSFIQIEVWGAQGARNGGKGAYMKGDFAVSPGDTLKILVGQKGFDGDISRTYLGGGGAGGSFVCKSNKDPMIIAGGGGGRTSIGTYTTMDGRSSSDGGDTLNNGGGNNGQGGEDGFSNAPAAGGGGSYNDGSNKTETGGVKTGDGEIKITY